MSLLWNLHVVTSVPRKKKKMLSQYGWGHNNFIVHKMQYMITGIVLLRSHFVWRCHMFAQFFPFPMADELFPKQPVHFDPFYSCDACWRMISAYSRRPVTRTDGREWSLFRFLQPLKDERGVMTTNCGAPSDGHGLGDRTWSVF